MEVETIIVGLKKWVSYLFLAVTTPHIPSTAMIIAGAHYDESSLHSLFLGGRRGIHVQTQELYSDTSCSCASYSAAVKRSLSCQIPFLDSKLKPPQSGRISLV